MRKERVINFAIVLFALTLVVMTFAAGEEAFGWFSHGFVVATCIYILVRK